MKAKLGLTSPKQLARSCLRSPRRLKSAMTQCQIVPTLIRPLFRKATVLVLLLVLIIAYLHFVVAPRATGTYNKACYLSEEERKDMVYLLVQVVGAFNKHNVNYWLEYGTLLGIWRQGEIIPYDGDIDIARLFTDWYQDHRDISALQVTLRGVGITINQWQAHYKNSTVDLFRMKEVRRGDKKILEHVPAETFGWFESVVIYFMPRTIQSDVILPTREVTAYGTKMKIPRRPLDFVKWRYPLTWFISFPYKWKCFMPF